MNFTLLNFFMISEIIDDTHNQQKTGYDEQDIFKNHRLVTINKFVDTKTSHKIVDRTS